MLSSQGSIIPAVFFPGKSYESVDSAPDLVEQIGGVLPDPRSQWESEKEEEAKAQDQQSLSPPPKPGREQLSAVILLLHSQLGDSFCPSPKAPEASRDKC